MFYSAVAASNLLPNSSQLFPLSRIDNAYAMPEADVYTLGNAYENCGKRILIRLDQNRSTLVELYSKD